MPHGFGIHNLFQDNQLKNAENIFFTVFNLLYEGSSVIISV